MPLAARLSLLAAAWLASGCAGLAARPGDCGAPAQAAARSLAARIDADGRFRYRLDDRGRLRRGYNIVRHAGSLWALADYRETFPGDAAVEAAAARASAYLADCCLRAPSGDASRLAVWSVPEGQPLEAKLGASGLALAAWSDRRRLGLPAPPLDDLRRLARFLVSLQDDDGRFASKFIVDRPDTSGWTSLYYPGEAALGLLAFARLDPAGDWHRPAARALSALAAGRIASGDWPPDHWALIATAELLRAHPASDSAALREQVHEIATRILAAQRDDGSFDAGLRTAPAATRLEALLAAEPLLAADDVALGLRLRAAIGRGARFLLRAQRPASPHAGAVSRAAPPSAEPRAGELRIDDTQHTLSVWLGARRRQNDSCTRA